MSLCPPGEIALSKRSVAWHRKTKYVLSLKYILFYLSKWYKVCFRKCTPLPLQNITGWRANSALALLARREIDSGRVAGGGGQGGFICSASNARPCSWPSKMRLWIASVSQGFSNRKVELEQRAGTRQTSSVKDYPVCHLGANIPINPSSSVSPRET